MLYREIIAVCSQIHTKHINTMCGQNVELLNVKPGGTYSDHFAVHIVTTGLYRSKFLRLVTPKHLSYGNQIAKRNREQLHCSRQMFVPDATCPLERGVVLCVGTESEMI